jgi:hypothetical protein
VGSRCALRRVTVGSKAAIAAVALLIFLDAFE